MKKLIFAAVSAWSVACFAQARETVRPGDAGLVRESPSTPIVAESPDRPQPVGEVNWTPFAVNFCSLSLPSAPALEVDGFRLNLSFPFATPDHRDVIGFDLGLAGEATGHVGGVAINLCDNWSESFSGGCLSLVNVTGELHGLQIGLVNLAECGSGLQIGLWNQSANFAFPFVGVVW